MGVGCPCSIAVDCLVDVCSYQELRLRVSKCCQTLHDPLDLGDVLVHLASEDTGFSQLSDQLLSRDSVGWTKLVVDLLP
jgi:hypothetical protein